MSKKISIKLRGLARRTVAAKVAYWDALREFEKATMPEGEETWSDRTNDKVHEEIENLAVGLDAPKDVYTRMDDAMTDAFIEVARTE